MLILLCLTIGLAPFNPPHIVEKLSLLFKGELRKAIDWLDLFLHGTPWLLLIIKFSIMVLSRFKLGGNG
ncbi:MAG: RND transporter [Clostridia bacterium]|nr:RND transporter [Clostridia bacterium]